MPILSSNKKAFVDYHISEKIECGVVLTGPEVKSVRLGQVNLKGSYIEISEKWEVWMKNVHISPYKQATTLLKDYNPTAKRKLLLNHKEIIKLFNELKKKGITAIPLDFHTNRNLIKVTIGLGQGKKQHDKRDDLKKKAAQLEMKRAVKKY